MSTRVARLLLPWLVGLVGCAANVSGSMGWHRANAAYTMGNYPGALGHVELEIQREGDPGQRAIEHGFAIVTLGKLAELEGEPTLHDKQTGRHYRDAKREAAGDPAAIARIEHAVASYYASTHRLRKGLPHMRAALAAAKKSGDEATRIASIHGMARMFAQMGELEVGDEYLRVATKLGDRAIGGDENPPPGALLDAWLELLDWSMQDALGRLDAAQRIEAIWPKMQRALRGIWRTSDKFKLNPVARESRLARRSILQMRAAAAFAAIGQRGKARELYEQVLADLDMWGGSVAIGPLSNRLDCTRADIEFSFGKLDRARKAAERCIGGAASPRDRAILEQQLLALLGLIREADGDLAGAAELYQRDIARFETIRKAIPIDERDTFFRGVGRVPWEGLIRVRTRAYMKTPSEQALQSLLEATDGMRARQLRELAGERATALSLPALRQTMAPDAVILSIALAGTEVSVVAITPSGAKAAITDVRPVELDDRLGRVVRAVSEMGGGAEQSVDLARLGQELFGGVAAELRSARRVSLVADGALNSFPVELLVVDGRSLGERATLAYSPSLSFLARSTPRRGEDRFWAMADPTYGAAPESIGYLGKSELSRGSKRGLVLSASFEPLPETRSEVLAIAELFEGRSDVTLGAEASEQTLRSKPPVGHAYVHFATHGILAGALPGLAEPALVLAGAAGSDGFLTASEVARMKLSADLAVLSACSTGTGDMLPGEGVMGMGRAFLVAGSRGVIASLWPVDSVATEALMVEFYRQHRSGLDAARALREAKRVIATQPRWQHPRYWSAFVLVAEGGLLVDSGQTGTAEPGAVPGEPGKPSGERGLVFKTDPNAPPPGAYADDYEILAPFE